jgi:hypothetical protein
MARTSGDCAENPPDVTGYRCDSITLADETYMRRWYPGPGPRLRYHEILRSDPDRDFHDHPWDFTSKLLTGAYLEVTPAGEQAFEAGDVIIRRARDLHRLVVLDGPVWTMVRTGPVCRQWGFQTTDGWVYWRDYRAVGSRSRRW